MKICKFCNGEFENKSIGGHTRACVLNPIKYESSKEAIEKLKKAYEIKRNKKKNAYLLNPKLCLSCNKLIAFEFSNNKYCNSSCAAKETNKLRKGIKHTLSELGLQNIRKGGNSRIVRFLKERECVICNSSFFHKLNVKTCSVNCKKNLMSKKASERLSKQENRVNYGRGKKSYLEKSFEDWLKYNNICNYETEKKIKNEILNKNYFVDFLFKRINLIIELDGTQHFKTVKEDKIRDNYLESVGYKVIRVSYKEYKEKTKEKMILKMLS